MMALNRYRMRHLAKEGHSGAKRATKLLERPDRLLGVILIGNNFVNFSAASIATLLAIQILGEEGVAWAPVICTFCLSHFRRSRTQNHCGELPRKKLLCRHRTFLAYCYYCCGRSFGPCLRFQTPYLKCLVSSTRTIRAII